MMMQTPANPNPGVIRTKEDCSALHAVPEDRSWPGRTWLSAPGGVEAAPVAASTLFVWYRGC